MFILSQNKKDKLEISICRHRKNVIIALKKLDMLYNTACLEQISNKLKYLMLEYVSEQNNLYTNNTLTLMCCSHDMESHIIFKMCGMTKIQQNTRLTYIHPKQIQGYNTYSVLIKRKRINVPPNKCIVESKWVFKKKRGIQLRARLVITGYTKIPGEDFTNKYSPVVTDVKLCVILLMWLLNKYYSNNMYIETEFYTQDYKKKYTLVNQMKWKNT